MQSDPTQHPEWNSWPLSERLVQLAAYHCDVLKVHEEPQGSNWGEWVSKYLAAAGIKVPAPWCASFVTYLLQHCGYKHCPDGSGRVANWAHWAESEHKIVTDPKRGDLFFFLNADGTGHMGIVLGRLDGTTNKLRTLEGNSNDEGSREGYEVCRRERKIAGLRFIRP